VNTSQTNTTKLPVVVRRPKISTLRRLAGYGIVR
jgi:hypothetical protein